MIIKAELLAKMGEVEEATSYLRKIDTTTRGAESMYLRGLIELNSGDSNKAKKFFTEGMRLDPDNQKIRQVLLKAKKGEALKEKGNELIKEQKYEEAAAQYTEALNIDPANRKLNAVIYSNRALTQMKQK